ncbi:MltA-interacting scaffolding protein [Bordetella ansorpii]|uniref:MltA-interacting scaffolding protein n=1 Tax=Bordetella ansorpii TaxID=288768 RepID=A0A157RH99_9BORD|nr:MipA/OmpV family protein [Bordetella ansorpii]SAI57284.1 MltA-interacting scaffolding protein [Bordetella ansorpii]
MKRRLPALAGLLLAGAALPQAYAQQNFIGIGAAVVPRYEGSDEYRVRPVPLVNYENGPFFISPRGGMPSLGLKMKALPDVTIGAFVGLNMGRDEDDADRLHGMGDIDTHATYGGFAEWTPGRFKLGAAYAQAAKSGYGGSLELSASYALVQTQRDRLSLGVSTVWSNDDAMQTWFGVSQRQAARSNGHLSAYDAGSGFRNASLSATWIHNVSGNWSVMSTAGVRTLLGDAKDSPLVERKTSVYGAVGVIYAF